MYDPHCNLGGHKVCVFPLCVVFPCFIVLQIVEIVRRTCAFHVSCSVKAASVRFSDSYASCFLRSDAVSACAAQPGLCSHIKVRSHALTCPQPGTTNPAPPLGFSIAELYDFACFIGCELLGVITGAIEAGFGVIEAASSEECINGSLGAWNWLDSCIRRSIVPRLVVSF